MELITTNGHSNHKDTGDMRDPISQADVNLEFIDDIHKGNMLASLNKMRKNRHFCDVILHVENVEIHAHRAVLASASPYLFELFTTDQEQNRPENVVTYKLNGGFSKDALEILVDYAYTAKIEVHYKQVKSVFLAANQLKMERVSRICAQHLIKHLSADNCIEIRSLPGIAKNKEFIQHIDTYIAKEFDKVSKLNNVLNLHCIQIELLNQTKEEMAMVNPNSLFRLILDWIKKQITEESLNMKSLLEKSFMLYVAIDNSLQDCSSMPTGDVSDTEIVQDYRKKSLKDTQPTAKSKRKILSQPSKPRILICAREIGEEEGELEPDWNLIATDQVGEHSYLGLVTIQGKLATISLLLRLNLPTTPSPVMTPVASRPGSEEKPDFYCTVANMSCQRCAFGCANLNNTLLVCGGYDRVECLRSCEQYIPETNVWKPLPTMRESRGRFKITVLNDKVYAIGGSNGTTELDSVEMYDASVGKWAKMPPLPLARSNVGVCTLDNLIYCVGGWNGQVGIKQCDVLDPETLKWSSIASLNTGRYQAGVAAFNELVYACGGCDAWNCLNSVEVYDTKENVWSFFKPLITARRGCGVAVFNNKLYVVGGSDGSHSLNSTEIFDEVSQNWVVGPSMTTPRANVEVAVVGDRLYAVGGFSGKNFLNNVEYLDLKTNEWTTFIPKSSYEQMIRRKPRSRRNSRKSLSEDKVKSSERKSSNLKEESAEEDKNIENEVQS